MTVADAALGVRCAGAALPGLGRSSRPLPTTHFRLVAHAELEAAWRADGPGTALHGTDTDDGEPFMRVWRTGAGSYHVEATGHGGHLLRGDGSECLSCLPEQEAAARRLLVAQVLPLAATLHGHVVLHAAGAVVGDDLIAISALSGTGKSTTLAHLLAAGAGYFADDTLAVQPGPELQAHPGSPWLQLLPEAFELLPALGRERLGEPQAQIGKLQLQLETPSEPQPLAAFVNLRRDLEEPCSRVVSEPVPATTLMRAPYVGYVKERALLEAQLDMVARIASDVRSAEFVLGSDGPQAAAAAVIDWVQRGR